MQFGSIILVIWPVTDAQIIAGTHAGPAISLVIRKMGNLRKTQSGYRSQSPKRCVTSDKHAF